MLKKIAFSLSLTLFSVIAVASEATVNHIMLRYIDGLEGGIKLALSRSEGMSLNQLQNLNVTVMRSAVQSNSLEVLVSDLFKEELKAGGNVKELIQNNPQRIINELDQSILTVHRRLENYHKAVVDSRNIGFRTTQAFDRDAAKVDNIVKKINKSRQSSRLPVVSRQIMASDAIKAITDINHHNGASGNILRRLSASVGESFTRRLVQGLKAL